MSRLITNAERRRLIRLQSKPEVMPFKMAWNRLMKTIKFRIKASEYLNKKVLYKGKYRKITGETLDSFFVDEFPRIAFPKVGNTLKIK